MAEQTATKSPPIKEVEKTLIPEVEIGEIVHWYVDGDLLTDPCAAIVTGIGLDTVNLSIMHPDLKNFQVKDGVYHLNDPRCRKAETRESGGWDFTPMGKKIRKLLL